MFRRLVIPLVVGATSLLVIPVGAAPVGAAQAAAPTSSSRACLHGGWHILSHPQGTAFLNQGQCVNWMLHHPVTLADLAGSFTGGTGSAVQSGGSCPQGFPAFYLTFDTTYPGNATVGTVTLHYEGCAQFGVGVPGPFGPGTFKIATNVGSVSGTATGTVTANLDRDFNVTVDLDLSFAVTAGTGAFATTTGTLSLAQHAPPFSPTTGTVTA